MNAGVPQLPNRSPWVLRIHEHAVSQYRANHDLVTAHNQHGDDLLLWFIGLAGGAIYLALQVIERFSPSMGFGWFIAAVLLWGLSALCGIIARILHAAATLEDDKVALIRTQELSGLPLRRDLDDARIAEEILIIFDPKLWPEDEARKIHMKAERLARSATWFDAACKGLLAAGIVWCPFLLWLHGRCA